MFKKINLLVILTIFLQNNIFCKSSLKLSDFKFDGASILPITKMNRRKIAVLGVEAFGKDAGTLDAFGGKRDSGETHPLITVSREMSEETKEIYDEKYLRKKIDLDSGNTEFIIANEGKKSVIYITNFNNFVIEEIFSKFYLKKAKNKSQEEKSNVGYVDWDELVKTIANAKRDHKGRLIGPVMINAKIAKLDKNNNVCFENKVLPLRLYFVSSLQSFCKDLLNNTTHFQAGLNPKIRFYKN